MKLPNKKLLFAIYYLLATAVANLQHTLKGVQGTDQEWDTMLRKTEQTLKTDFQKEVLWAQMLIFYYI